MQYKPYSGDWELLGDAAKRLMNLGATEEQTRTDLCRALYDGRIRFLAKLDSKDPDAPNYECRSSEGEVYIPRDIAPEKFDWANSRPKTAWSAGNDRLDFPRRPRQLEWIKLRREDVDFALGLPEEFALCADRLEEKQKRTTGPKTGKKRRAVEEMRSDLKAGCLSRQQLVDLPGKELAHRYHVGRTLAQEARNAILSELDAISNSGNSRETTNSGK
jgi:hypothetical protein